MPLLVCRRCSTRFALGLPRCPNCTATDHYIEGEEGPMAKIHRDREPTYRPTPALGELAHGAPGPAQDLNPAGEVGQDPTPGPDTDYGSRTVVELRQLLRERNTGRHEAEQLPLSGNKPDLVMRLQVDDEATAGADNPADDG